MTFDILIFPFIQTFFFEGVVMIKDTQIFSGPGDIECEPDEYSELVKALRKSGIIKDHRSGLTTYKNSFSGRDFVDWVVRTKELGESYFHWSGCLALSH